MRLEDLEPRHFREAIRIYLEHAFPEGTPAPRVDLSPFEAAKDVESALSGFERGDPGDDPTSRRFTLRLGNHRYPFMKFVFQEHLVAHEFFFSVDTHDRLDVPPESPDYAEWEALKVANRELAARIEAAWAAAGLPTHADLRRLLDRLAEVEREEQKRHRLLLVDDDRAVCKGLAALLRARGYEVEEVHDGRAALERLEREPRPDLVLLDYEMPEFDGQAVLRRMRETPGLADVPVLLATAARIDLSQLADVSGLLHKPYPRGVLFEMLERILPQEPSPGLAPNRAATDS